MLRRHRPARGAGGQATVETALVLPVVAVLILLVVQAGLVMRDRLLVVHVARVAAREVAVRPDVDSARAAVTGIDPDRVRVTVGGDTSPGGLAVVTVAIRPARLPIVGLVVSGITLREQLTVRVEGG